MESNTSLQLVYFTREVPGYEVEMKYAIVNREPWLSLCQMMNGINLGLWDPFLRQRSMGAMSSQTRYLDLLVEFWGVEISGVWQQTAMCIKHPWQSDKYMVVFKNTGSILSEIFREIGSAPLMRREESRYQWMDRTTAVSYIRKRARMAQPVGTVRRQKYSIYIYNRQTYRNYCLSCDICVSGGQILSQMEIEYKGRSGMWFVHTDMAIEEIAIEYRLLQSILKQLYGAALLPTTVTKFDWLTSLRHN